MLSRILKKKSSQDNGLHSALKQKAMSALETIQDPENSESNIVEQGTVSSMTVTPDNDIIFVLNVNPDKGEALEPLRQKAETLVSSIQGVRNVTAILTAEKPLQETVHTGDKRTKPSNNIPDPHGMNKNPRLDLPVRHIIAVASGKGGVGKSTVAVNLALSLSKTNQSVGLLDADIYGPSGPLLMGVKGKKPEQKNNKIHPIKAHGICMMSIGFLVENEAPLIWRGPMVQTAIYQMLRDVHWADEKQPLDYLIVDMPPGTGDAQLTMAQKVPLSGAIIVSTPQDIALIDARKGIEMFRKVGVPVLGLIENMSTYTCPNCGHEDHIFDHNGGRTEAETLDIPFLGALPLSRKVRETSDAGTPIVGIEPNNSSSEVFMDIAEKLNKELP